MHIQRPHLRGLRAALLVTAALFATAAASHAALITWGAATNITGDTDVSTAGTLLTAVNLGSTGANTTVTVNSVTFNQANISANAVNSGNFSFTGVFFAPSSPFAGLSPQYNGLLTSGIAGGGTPITLTISGLSVGTQYLFQFWDHAAGGTMTAAAGNSVSLSGTAGGFGQFALGTFTADAPSQVITFSGTGASVVSAAQLRVVPPSVPEPGTALAGVLAAGLLGLRRRRG